MALLVITVSLVVPTMSKFFGGRSLDSEVKRMTALIHYGQSRAVNDGVPMMLWIDSAHGSYGLEVEPGYGGDDRYAVENKLANGLKIDVVRNNTKVPVANSQTGRIKTGQVIQRKNKLPAFYFEPDGSFNALRSTGGISLEDKSTQPVWIIPSDDQSGFSIQRESPNGRRS